MARNRKSNRAAVAEKPAQALNPEPDEPPRLPRRLNRGKQFLFLFICAWLFPALALLLSELTLRAAGYGFSPSFFLERNVDGRKVLTDNPRFGWRFFPPTIARRPHDFVIPASKPPGTFRIFLFGESAAWGDPDPSYGMARILEVLLADQFPGTKFEVVNSAMAAISSHVVYQIAREAARQDPDLFIVYMGNNEVIGPFGPGTVFSGFSPSISSIRTVSRLKGLALVQFLTDLKRTAEGLDRQPQAWAGMQMFEENKVRSDDPRLEGMYRHFARNLADIVRTGCKAGAGVVVCNMAANFGQWGPHASQHRAGMGAKELHRWEELFGAGRIAEEAGRWEEAVSHYREAAAVDGTYADLQYRMGRCLVRLERHDEAREHLHRAVDEDCLRFRTDSRINTLIRETAEAEGAEFVDIRRLFEAHSPHAIPGLNLLDDHVHMNFRGNYLIAGALLPEVAKQAGARIGAKPRDLSSPLSEAACREQLACTGYNQFRIAERNLQRIKNPPFNAQSDHAEHLAFFTALLDELSTHTAPAGLQSAAEAYERASARRPDDWVLFENQADLFQRAGDSPRETAALKRVLQLLPHHEERFAWLAQSLFNQGRLEEAAECYRKAIAYDPANNKAHAGLGSILIRQGQLEEGIRQFKAAIEARPGLAGSWNELGEVYYKADRLDDAEQAFTEATRLDPAYALAYTNLGVLSISRGRPGQAEEHLRAALKARPDFPDALRHMGKLLLQTGRGKEGAEYYESALKLSPHVAVIRKNFGLFLLEAGRKAEGRRQLERALELAPADGQVRQILSQIQRG